MTNGLKRVVVAGTGGFLPNEPVANEDIPQVLGPLTDAPPRIQGFVENVIPRMLAAGGVEARHFSIDRETHHLTHTVTDLAEEAARRALDSAGVAAADVDLLMLSAPVFDYGTPPTTTILQERLGIKHCAEIEVHSNCSGVGKSVQIAYDALRLGRYKTALITYAQHSSVYLRSCYFNQAQINKKQATLRYILADGAGAVVLQAVDSVPEGGHELLGTYAESVGADREPGMTAGGGVAEFVDPQSQLPGMYDKGRHHLDQDFHTVSAEAVPYLVAGVRNMLSSLNMSPGDIDHYLYSIPSRHLYETQFDKVTTEMGVQPECVKFRAAHTGYTGGASILLHLDEVARSGEAQPGQRIVCYSVESSKWMSAGFVVRW